MSERIEIVDYNPAWALRFVEIGTGLRQAVGDLAVRIDHIGSTAVRGLAAKPIVDIQMSIPALAAITPVRDALQAQGWVHRPHNPDLTKRYFREAPGALRTHVHVREAGSWSEQFALLFRDYLREHEPAAQRYAARKRVLAVTCGADRAAYTDGKGPIVWELIALANTWSQAVGWRAAPSDA